MTLETHMREPSLKLPYSCHGAGMCLVTAAFADGCAKSTSARIAALK